jgi:hypothetical protein
MQGTETEIGRGRAPSFPFDWLSARDFIVLISRLRLRAKFGPCEHQRHSPTPIKRTPSLPLFGHDSRRRSSNLEARYMVNLDP